VNPVVSVFVPRRSRRLERDFNRFSWHASFFVFFPVATKRKLRFHRTRAYWFCLLLRTRRGIRANLTRLTRCSETDITTCPGEIEREKKFLLVNAHSRKHAHGEQFPNPAALTVTWPRSRTKIYEKLKNKVSSYTGPGSCLGAAQSSIRWTRCAFRTNRFRTIARNVRAYRRRRRRTQSEKTASGVPTSSTRASGTSKRKHHVAAAVRVVWFFFFAPIFITHAVSDVDK